MTTPVTPGQSPNATYAPPRDDVVTQMVAAFIQKNWDSHYRAAWTKLGSPTGLKPGASWNWAAAFVPVAWLAYRRQWLAAFGIFALSGAISLIPFVNLLGWVTIFIVMGMYGNRIVLKRAWESADSAIRQHGDSDAARAQAAAAGGTSFAALLIFIIIPFGIVFIGILAAIAIPKFASTKARAYQSVMMSDLRNLRTAEETYFADSTRYSADLRALHFVSGTNVTAPVITIGPNGTSYTATVGHATAPQTCALAVGMPNPLGVAPEGEPICR
jgi:type IV pilus assembly protein PilA